MVDEIGSAEPAERINEATFRDIALVVEALAAFAGPPGELETQRERRAWELISDLAADLDMTPSTLLQVEPHFENDVRSDRTETVRE